MKHLEATDFDVFKYTLPARSTSSYAQKAIKILQTLPVQYLPYFLSSDIVLTLSGVRAFDTYITFEGLEAKYILQFQKTLAARGFTLATDTNEYEEDTGVYYLVNHEALRAIPSQYKLEGWFNPNPPYTIERMIIWTYFIEATLSRGLMMEGKLPKAWLKHPFSAHDIRFGILLGYPGEAIACGCWMDVLGEKQMPNALSSKIVYHNAYDAAWPTYYYTDAVKNNPHILAHQKLWSDILTKVYESPWHRKLQSDQQFSEAAAKIHKLKEPYEAESTT